MFKIAWRCSDGWMLSKSLPCSRKSHCPMFQTTSPLSFLISLLAGTASRPRLASSKSGLSAKGRIWRCRFCASTVKVEGSLPFGLKCPVALRPSAPGRKARQGTGEPSRQAARLESLKRFLAAIRAARKGITVHPIMVRSSFAGTAGLCASLSTPTAKSMALWSNRPCRRMTAWSGRLERPQLSRFEMTREGDQRGWTTCTALPVTLRPLEGCSTRRHRLGPVASPGRPRGTARRTRRAGARDRSARPAC